METCNLEPFRYQATPQSVGEQGASASQINDQHIEDYLNRLKIAVCADLEAIVAGIDLDISFLDLNDTPDSYLNHAGQVVVVNQAETGLEFESQIDVTGLLSKLVVVWSSNHSTGLTLGDGASETGTTTVTEVNATPANMIQAHARTVKTTGAGAGSTANSRCTGTGFLAAMGSGTNLGGFTLIWRFGLVTTVAQQAAFVGLHNSGAAIGNVNPSTLLSVLAFAYDPTETVWSFMHNDGAGTATKVSLGANFPINNSHLFEGTISNEPGSTTVDYRLKNLSTGNEVSGTVSTDIPPTTSRFVPQIWIGNRTTAAAASIAHVFMSLESGNS